MNDVTKAYAPTFEAWPVKQVGSKPTAELLTTAHHFGRAGKQSLALAMAMRPEGVTGAQIVMVCGAPQNNHRRGLLASGFFKRDNTVPQNDQGHTVYKITLTPRGEAAMKRRIEAAANGAVPGETKPAKGKAVKAASKRKGAGKAKPATPTAPVAENVPSEAPEGFVPSDAADLPPVGIVDLGKVRVTA